MDVFVAKLDASGQHVFSHRFGDAANDQGAVAVGSDPSGNVIVAGWLMGSIDFGLGALTPASNTTHDGFVVKLGPLGDTLWSKQLPGLPARVRTTSGSDVLVAGAFRGDGSFPPLRRKFVGGTDVFLIDSEP
jgi:hypothetical protein